MATKILNDRNLQLAAESISGSGYVEPHLNLLDWGNLHLLRVGDTKVTRVQTIDLTNHLRTAWPQILASLPQGTPIPDALRTPRFFGNGRMGVTIDQKGIKVEMWVNRLDIGFNKLTASNGKKYFQSTTKIPGMYYGADTHNGSRISCLLLGYETIGAIKMYAGDVFANAIGITDQGFLRVYNPDFEEKSAEELTASLQGQYLLYELATPITLSWTDLGLTELNITLPNISTGDILVMADSDGIPTHSVTLALDEAYQTEDGKKHCPLLIGYNPEWQAKHPGEFPSAPVMQWTGHEWTANYRNIYADHLLLQNVLDILKRNNLN